MKYKIVQIKYFTCALVNTLKRVNFFKAQQNIIKTWFKTYKSKTFKYPFKLSVLKCVKKQSWMCTFFNYI